MTRSSATGWLPAIRVWRWNDSPEELKVLAGDSTGAYLIYIPPQMLEDGELDATPTGLSFLEFPTKANQAWQMANQHEEYLTINCPDGGRIAIVSHAVY